MDTKLAIAGFIVAFIAIVLGVGVTIAMDAKTRGEFRFAAGCFVVAGLILVLTVGVWEVNTSASFSWRTTVSVLVLVFIIYGTIESIRWTQRRHENAREAITDRPKTPEPPKTTEKHKERTQPIEKIQPLVVTNTFSTMVPFSAASVGAPILTNDNFRDIHAEFDVNISTLAAQSRLIRERDFSNADLRFKFLTRLMQYYIFHEVWHLGRSSQGVKVTIGEGAVPINRPAIMPPDSSDYNAEEIVKLLADNDFVIPAHIQLYRTLPFRVPKGSVISLFENSSQDKPFECVVRLKKDSEFNLDFIISSSGAIDSPPQGFVSTIKPIESYIMKISVHLEVDNVARSEKYKEWSGALFEGLKKQMAY